MEPALILTMPIPHARRRVAPPSIDRRDGLGAGSIRSPTFCVLASLFRIKAAALEGRVIRARRQDGARHDPDHAYSTCPASHSSALVSRSRVTLSACLGSPEQPGLLLGGEPPRRSGIGAIVSALGTAYASPFGAGSVDAFPWSLEPLPEQSLKLVLVSQGGV